MKTYDNSGKLIGEINTIIRPGPRGISVIQTTTTYGRGEQPMHQTVQVRETDGMVRIFEVRTIP